jgi:hypothetical protein
VLRLTTGPPVGSTRHGVAGRVQEQVDHLGRPARLVHGSEPGTGVAMEVLGEPEQSLPGGVGLQELDLPEYRTTAVGTGEPDGDESIAEVLGDVGEGPLPA